MSVTFGENGNDLLLFQKEFKFMGTDGAIDARKDNKKAEEET